jgi:hypothetical protein
MDAQTRFWIAQQVADTAGCAVVITKDRFSKALENSELIFCTCTIISSSFIIIIHHFSSLKYLG